MNYYNVEFWKNAEHPRKGAPDKNKHEHAWTKEEAEKQARTAFGLFPERFEYPWACRVTAMSPEVPPLQQSAVPPSLASPDAGAASGAGAAEAPSAVADSAAPGDLVSELLLSDRAKSALAREGITTQRQLREFPDLTNVPGVGPAVAREILSALGLPVT